jgi:hypothetical protein
VIAEYHNSPMGVAEFKYDSARKRNGFVFQIMQ